MTICSKDVTAILSSEETPNNPLAAMGIQSQAASNKATRKNSESTAVYSSRQRKQKETKGTECV